MDREGLNHQAVPTEGWGDGACMASVVQVDLIHRPISGRRSPYSLGSRLCVT